MDRPDTRTRWVVPDAATERPAAAFLPLLRAAVAAAPDRPEPALGLARALTRAGLTGELIEWLAPVGDAERTTHAELLFHLGCAHATTGDAPRALAPLQAAAARGFTPAYGYLAETLLRLGRHDEALSAGCHGLDADPADFKPLGVVTRILLERGETARLWDLCTRLRGIGVRDAYLASAMARSATTPAQIDAVAGLVDPQRWLCARDLGMPGGFDAALRDELLAHPARGGLPAAKATTGTGERIDQLHLAAGPRARELLAAIRNAVDEYLAARPDAACHPFLGPPPASMSLVAWAVAVQRDGHEAWHLHARGYLSGVYYVAVPDDPSGDGCAGAIAFGPMPFGATQPAPAWPPWRIRPEPGLLLLFPSWYGHRTWPTQSEQTRLCVAFDALPAPHSGQ
jgi:hypothetical protein